MEMPSTLKKINLSSVSGPHQVLGLFLLVAEGWLGYWLVRAESPLERGFTGLVMLLILAGLVYAVIRLKEADTRPVSILKPGASVQPPKEEATAEEIANPAPENFPAPDRSYLINLPPEGWKIRELTNTRWLAETLGIKDPTTTERLFPSMGQAGDILVIEREKQTSIIPTPGRSIIDGRKFPSALETLVPTQLSILPIDRAQPPLFVERSLEHNFLVFVGQMLAIGVLTVRNSEGGRISNSDRRYLRVDLQQDIKRATVNGKEDQNAVITISIIGIESELRDHVLLIRYPTVPGDPEVERDLQNLQALVASFRPLKVINAEEKRKEMSSKADEKFKEFIAEKGTEMFTNELILLLFRLQGVNLDDPEARLHAMQLLLPFEALAHEISLHDEGLDVLWEALHRAQTGDATDFKAKLTELVQDVGREEEEEDKKDEGATLTSPAVGALESG